MVVIGKYDPHAPLMFRWTWEFIGTPENPYPNNYEIVMKHMRGEEKFKLPELPKNSFRFIITTRYVQGGKIHSMDGHPLVCSGT